MKNFLRDYHIIICDNLIPQLLCLQDVDVETFQSSVSEDGIMTLQADIKGAEKAEEKTIEIKFEPKKKD